VQDNATAHTANNFMDALADASGKWVANQELCPLLPPDLNPYDLYLWGTVREKMYVKNLHFLE
jgi:hypothetical protein